jgi:sugar phosphate isomerase/epimerase
MTSSRTHAQGRIRLALCAETLGESDFTTQCAFARKLGYEGLELAPWRLGPEPQHVPSERRREWRRVAEEEGIAITGFHYALVSPPGLSITSADPALRARTLEVMKGLCELCADLGGAYVVHGSPEQRRLEQGDEEACRCRGAEAYAQAGEFAAAAGITYLIEPVRPSRTPFINTVAEAAEIVHAAGNPALRTMLDCCSGAQAETQPLDHILDRWLPGGMIAHVHANDPNLRGPGEGDLRFASIFAALCRNAYDGWVAVEPFVFQPDGRSCAARAAGYLSGLLEAS